MKTKIIHYICAIFSIALYAENIDYLTKCPNQNNKVDCPDQNHWAKHSNQNCWEKLYGCKEHHDKKQKCKRGKRGERGRRGPRGPRGEQGEPGTNAPILLTEELFMNAPMITNATGDTPDTSFAFTYGIPTVLEAWAMPFPLLTSNPAFGSQFLIPVNLDRTQPVTLTMHFFNAEEEVTGDIRLQIQTDYMQTNEIIGVNPPADGYAETILTGNIPVVNPTGPNNLRYFTVSVALDPTLMINKTWAVVVVSRIFTTNDNDFPGSIFLTGISIRYTRQTV